MTLELGTNETKPGYFADGGVATNYVREFKVSHTKIFLRLSVDTLTPDTIIEVHNSGKSFDVGGKNEKIAIVQALEMAYSECMNMLQVVSALECVFGWIDTRVKTRFLIRFEKMTPKRWEDYIEYYKEINPELTPGDEQAFTEIRAQAKKDYEKRIT